MLAKTVISFAFQIYHHDLIDYTVHGL